MEKRTMTSKQWLAAFIATPAAAALLVLAFNFIMDPFCAFGDRFFQWWAYGETLNPRVAKIEYLEQHHQEYDSYIIGSSSASSYPVEKLNELFDAKFYNAFMYGSDLYDVELMSRYIVENYEVKYLLLSLYIQNASQYNVEPDPLTYGLHYRADGSKPLDYLKKYLFLHPRYSLEKLRRCLDDSYLTRAYDVFDPDTGAYDKKTRDVEPIGDLDSYLALPAYAGFASYPPGSLSIPRLEECMASVRAIKELCEARGVELIVACPPMYHEFMSYFTREDAAAFSRALAQVTDYWDFTLSPVSFEPRYFYDETHFRNCVGGMAVAKMAGSSSVYVPEGFAIM